MFDTVLLLQSLLTHLCASGDIAVDAATVDASLRAYPDLQDALPNVSKALRSQRLGTYLHTRCPAIHHLLFRSHDGAESTASAQASLPGLLVGLLYLETVDFLRDLEETDEAINSSTASAATATATGATGVAATGTFAIQDQQGGSPRPAHASPARTTVTSPPQQPSSAQRSKKASRSDALPIPVAELVVAAHASLLLHTLEKARGDSSDLNAAKRITSTNTDAPPNSNVLATLPRGGWWLCARVLKAFLTLQGQVSTHIVLLAAFGHPIYLSFLFVL